MKIQAGLNIAERRLPQDGRMKAPDRGQDVDIRVSTLPTAHGESVVLRTIAFKKAFGIPPAKVVKT
uniref:ATPase, T2SS/T4P/T4SS family n=1 Tax=Mangrovicoccus ximenensis TaxID=1911570 RepID=UPI002ED62524